MTISLDYHTDAALTTPLPGNLIIQQAIDGSTGPVQSVLFLGSNALARKFQTEVSPGVGTILLTIVDATPAVGHLPSEIKLATTQVGLASAVPGDPLDLGTTLFSEVVNAQEVWIEVDDPNLILGTEVDLSVNTNSLIELDV